MRRNRAIDRVDLRAAPAGAREAADRRPTRLGRDRGRGSAEPPLRLHGGRCARRPCGQRRLGWWWLDPVIALAIAALAVSEGREAWAGEGCCVGSPIRLSTGAARTAVADRNAPARELSPGSWLKPAPGSIAASALPSLRRRPYHSSRCPWLTESEGRSGAVDASDVHALLSRAVAFRRGGRGALRG